MLVTHKMMQIMSQSSLLLSLLIQTLCYDQEEITPFLSCVLCTLWRIITLFFSTVIIITKRMWEAISVRIAVPWHMVDRLLALAIVYLCGRVEYRVWVFSPLDAPICPCFLGIERDWGALQHPRILWDGPLFILYNIYFYIFYTSLIQQNEGIMETYQGGESKNR